MYVNTKHTYIDDMAETIWNYFAYRWMQPDNLDVKWYLTAGRYYANNR